MRLSLTLLLLSLVFPTFSQERATIRVEVKFNSAPVERAAVSVNGDTVQTDRNGIAVRSAALGGVEITAVKEGFLPARASLPVNEAREWQIVLELQPQQSVEEKITVYATRTDTRLQDSPIRVEVL